MSEQKSPYCGSSVEPVTIQLDVYAVSISLKLYHCKICGRWFELLNPNLEYLLSNMYLEKSVLEFLRGRYGVTCYREFLERNFVGSARRSGRENFVRWIITSVKKREISSPFPYDFIIRVGETGGSTTSLVAGVKIEVRLSIADDITPV